MTLCYTRYLDIHRFIQLLTGFEKWEDSVSTIDCGMHFHPWFTLTDISHNPRNQTIPADVLQDRATNQGQFILC